MRRKSSFATKLISFALTSLFLQSAGLGNPVAAPAAIVDWFEDIDDATSIWFFYSSPAIEDVTLLANAGRNFLNNQFAEA